MTTVNFTIEAMTRRGSLAGVLAAYLYAALLVAGPWIFTVLGLFSLNTTCEGSCGDLAIFRSVVIYNSMFALVVTSPLAFISGRYVSERLHGNCRDNVFYALVVALSVFGFLSLGFAVPFYVLATTLSPAEKIAAIQNVMMIGSSWLLIPFLGAVKSYATVLFAFTAGALSLFAAAGLLHDAQVVSLLLAFNGSIAVTNVIMLSALVRRFRTEIVADPGLKNTLNGRWELLAAGFAYALGLWVDKIIMWFSAPSGKLVVAGALQTMPSYDTAMFWSQLSSIPVIAVFFVHVETRFSTLVRTLHTRTQQQASLRELNEITKAIATHVLSSLFGLFAVLVIVAAMMIAVSFVFMADLGLRPAYMGILRVSLCSMAFYTSAMFCFNFLLHLDLRRQALQIVCIYLVLNAALTAALLPLGSNFYGYGNMIAAMASLLFGFSIVLKELPWIHYHAFITNNPSLAKQK